MRDPTDPLGSTSAPAWRVWWRLARPFSLTASIVPVLVGTAGAIADGSFRSVPLFGAMLLASVLIQIATNMFNEYYDYRRGLDTPTTVGIAGAIVQGAASPGAVFAAAGACFAGALALGIFITVQSEPIVFLVGVACALAGWIYTGGPRPIAYTPLGELEVFVFMGPVMVGLAYFIQSGRLGTPSMLASIPVGCLVAAILLANNIRDRQADALAGRATLPIVAGKGPALVVYGVLLGGAFATTIAGVLASQFPPTAALPLITGVLTPGLVHHLRSEEAPAQLNASVRGSAGLHARFGLLLALGIAAGPLIGWPATRF